MTSSKRTTKTDEPQDDIMRLLSEQQRLYGEVLRARGAAAKVNMSAQSAIGDAKAAYDSVVAEENAKMEAEADRIAEAEKALTDFKAATLEDHGIELPNLLASGGGSTRI